MGMSITGEAPTTEWGVPGFATLNEIAAGFAVLGTKANATFLRVDLEGVVVANSLDGYNLHNGILFQGTSTGPLEIAPPLSGSFIVKDSTVRHAGSAMPVANLSGVSILISGNTLEDVGLAGEVAGVLNSMYAFSFNAINQSFIGVDIYDYIQTVPYVTSSQILISNNVFRSEEYGVILEATFEGGSRAQAVSNNFQNTSVLGIYLGPNTSHCILAGNSPTTIQNQGTDNLIVNKSSAP
jgi:hypothetical protein